MDCRSFIVVALLVCPLATFGKPVGGKYEFDISSEVRTSELYTFYSQ